jgi:dipeptidase D
MKISDLPGGHSGLKINLDIPNPVVEIASTFFQNLHRWESHWDVHLVGISAGEKRNVIANSATISLVVRNDKLERLRQELGGAMMARFFEHKEMTSGKISFSSKPVDADAPISYVPSAQAYKVSRGIMEIAHGAIEYTHYDPKLVATSNNVAILNVNPEQATLQCLTRSSIDGGAALVQSGMEAIVAKHGAKVHKSQGYPGWDCPPNDPFLLLASATFKRHFGEKPVLHRAHGGIECGAFRLVRPDLQMISLAINILDAHTTKERVEVDSVSELWGYLKSLASDLC